MDETQAKELMVKEEKEFKKVMSTFLGGTKNSHLVARRS